MFGGALSAPTAQRHSYHRRLPPQLPCKKQDLVLFPRMLAEYVSEICYTVLTDSIELPFSQAFK